MSTADDRGYDPLVQGAGWMNASRGVDVIYGIEVPDGEPGFMDDGGKRRFSSGWKSEFPVGQNQTMHLIQSGS